jgi:hypothetical protein
MSINALVVAMCEYGLSRLHDASPNDLFKEK